MKNLRATAKSSMAAKLARYCGGDVKRVQKGMPSRDGSKGYANGGGISDEDEGDIDGVGAKPSMSKPGRTKGKDKDKKGGTNVNVIIMPKEGGAPAGAAMPPGPPPPPPGPPGPPPGGPPIPMRARGGRVAVSLKKDGAGGGLGRLAKMKAYGPKPGKAESC